MTIPRYLLYLCGQVGMMALARFFFQWIVDYPQSSGGVGPGGVASSLFVATTVGWVFLGFRIFDGVTDPIAGMVSDGWVRRGRERRTLLWFACLLPSVGLAMVFWPTAATGPVMRWVLLAGGMFVFFVGYTFYAIPYWSLINDYSRDEPTRRVMSNLLGAGMLIATLLGFLVSGDLIDRLGYRVAALWFAGPALLLMVLPYFAQPAAGPRAAVSTSESPALGLKAFKTAFGHRRFLSVLAIFSGSQMSFTVMSASVGLIVVQLLGGTKGDLKFVMGPFLLCALPTFALVPWLSRRLGWERAVAGVSLILALAYVGTALVGRALIGSPMLTAGIIYAIAGPLAAVLLGLEGEAITACASEVEGDVTSVYFGVYNLVVKGMNGVAVLLTSQLAVMSSPDRLGLNAIRLMGVMAGAMLAVGLVAYFAVRPRDGAVASPAD